MSIGDSENVNQFVIGAINFCFLLFLYNQSIKKKERERKREREWNTPTNFYVILQKRTKKI